MKLIRISRNGAPALWCSQGGVMVPFTLILAALLALSPGVALANFTITGKVSGVQAFGNGGVSVFLDKDSLHDGGGQWGSLHCKLEFASSAAGAKNVLAVALTALAANREVVVVDDVTVSCPTSSTKYPFTRIIIKK